MTLNMIPYDNEQVLVYHDLLGMMQHAHHAKVAPAFAKRYGAIGEAIQTALDQYRSEVESGVFPGEKYSPYKMLKDEATEFAKLMATDRAATAASGVPRKSVLPPLPPPPQIIEPPSNGSSTTASTSASRDTPTDVAIEKAALASTNSKPLATTKEKGSVAHSDADPHGDTIKVY
jgi:hypothetical protein